MKDPSITWRRTFPDSAPDSDGVVIFEGRVIGRVRLLADPERLADAMAQPDAARCSANPARAPRRLEDESAGSSGCPAIQDAPESAC